MKILISTVLLLMISSCNSQKKEDCLINLEKRVAPSLNQEIEQGEIINFRDNINCIQWDSLVVVMAMGDKESVEKYTGIKIPYNYDGSSLYSSDSDAMIFFLKDRIAINHILVKGSCSKGENCRAYDFLDLMGHSNHAFVAKEDAVFEVYSKKIHDNQGNSWTSNNEIRIKI